MPGSVLNAAPSTVLPKSLCRAFVHDRAYEVLENEYPDGASQRSRITLTSRKRWRLAKRLSASELGTLRAFYEARKGGHEPFYFYDPYETSPLFSHDPTGGALPGRYTVRFEGGWGQAAWPARLDCEIALVELG